MDKKTLTAMALFAGVTQLHDANASIDLNHLKITEEEKVSQEEFENAIHDRLAARSTYSNWNTASSSYSNWNTTASSYSNWNTTSSSYSNWNTTAASYSNWNLTASSYSNWSITGSRRDAINSEVDFPGPRVAVEESEE